MRSGWLTTRRIAYGSLLVIPALRAESVETKFGEVDLLQMIAVSRAERDLAYELGLDALLERLRGIDGFACLDVPRRGVV